MNILIDGYKKSIHKKDNQIIIKEKDQTLDSIKASKISNITIIGKGYITFDALNLIGENNIQLLSFDYLGNLKYILKSPNEENIQLRKKQYHLSENKKGIELSKTIIKSKIKNQKSTLRTLNKNKKIKTINKSIEKITQQIKEIETIQTQKEIQKTKIQIMAIEGKASNEYWKAIKKLTPKEINFQKRNKKPTDLLNSMLNYGYAILSTEITKSIINSGLDPYCGFLHFDLNKRKSLTYDLIEPYRQQLVDKTIITLINKKQITNEDLDKRNNSLKLEKRKLIASKILDKIHTQITYNNEITTYKQIINKQTQNLKNSILNDTEFPEFYLRWWGKHPIFNPKKWCPQKLKNNKKT